MGPPWRDQANQSKREPFNDKHGGAILTSESKYKAHSKETAICVELALNTVEADIRTELERTGGLAAEALNRILEKMRERRRVLVQFTEAA